MTKAFGRQVQLRDVAVAANVTWLDHSIRGSLDGSIQEPAPGTQTSPVVGDLELVTLGDAGVAVYDVSSRGLGSLIGRLHVEGSDGSGLHSIYRVQVDEDLGMVLAGGFDGSGTPIIDVWQISAVNGFPGSSIEPRPLTTITGVSWATGHVALDHSGTNLVLTWDGGRGTTARPVESPTISFAGLVYPSSYDAGDGDDVEPVLMAMRSQTLAPLGVALEINSFDERARRVANEQDRPSEKTHVPRTAAFKLRVALPGSVGETVTAKIESLRVRPDSSLLAREDLGEVVCMPGGTGWPEREAFVTLRRLGDGEADGRLDSSYNHYESDEIVLLIADPRACKGYELQQPALLGPALDASERHQCRRCERPAFLSDEDDVLELLAAGPYLRAVIAPACAADDTTCSAEDQQASEAARAYRELTDELGAAYRPAVGLARLVGWADMVPSPIQISLAEPAQGVIQWPLGEAGAAVSLVSGDALIEATDYANVGRSMPVAMSRSYRSGTVGFGPLGAAGWHSPLLAHLRRNPVTGEVRYADGAGNVWRFLPIDHGCLENEGFEKDTLGRYCVPIGLPVDLEYRGIGKGWRMVDRYGAASLWCQEIQCNSERGIHAAYLRRLALEDARFGMRIRESFAARERTALSIEQTNDQPVCDRERTDQSVRAMLRSQSSQNDTRGAAHRAQAQPRSGIYQGSDIRASLMNHERR